jgi:hypothetical protein
MSDIVFSKKTHMGELTLGLDFAIKHRVLQTAQLCSGLQTRGNKPGQ